MGEDNFWKMGDTGPCGPSSEMFFDKGRPTAAPGGPAFGGAERFVEIWNLVFMQYNRIADGHHRPPAQAEHRHRRRASSASCRCSRAWTRSSPPTSFVPMIETAQSITGHTYGEDEQVDVGLRILADHGRAMAMLVADGVLPANEGRGYVLRRIIRRAVRRARQLGVDRPFTPTAGGRRRRRSWGRPIRPWPSSTDWSPMSWPGRRRASCAPWPRGPPSSRSSWRRGGRLGVGRRGLPAPRHLRVPGRAHHGDRRGGRGGGRPGGFRGGHGPSSGPGPGRPPVPAGPAPASRPTARSSTPRARRSSSANGPTGTRSRPGSWRCWPIWTPIAPARPRSSSTGPPSTPRVADRSATPGPSSPRRGRPSSTTPCRPCPGSPPTGRGSPVTCSPARTPWPPSTASAATRCGATTPVPTSSTPPCGRCSGTMCGSRAHWWHRTGCASTSATTGGVAPEELAEVAALANADVLTDADVIVEETTKARGGKPWGPWPSSATSTASGCGWSAPAPTPSSSAAGPTSGPWG